MMMRFHDHQSEGWLIKPLPLLGSVFPQTETPSGKMAVSSIVEGALMANVLTDFFQHSCFAYRRRSLIFSCQGRPLCRLGLHPSPWAGKIVRQVSDHKSNFHAPSIIGEVY